MNQLRQKAGIFSLLCSFICTGWSEVAPQQPVQQVAQQAPQQSAGINEELSMGTAVSIRNQFEEDTRPKQNWFELPFIDDALRPWQETRSKLADDHGFRQIFRRLPCSPRSVHFIRRR